MSHLKHFIFLTLLVFSFPLISFSQSINPVKWEITYNDLSDTEGEIIIKATIEDKWHIYSQKQNGDGPIPTNFKFIVSPDFELVGQVIEPKPENNYSDVFQSNVLSFSKQVIFKQKIKRHLKKQFFVYGELEFMSCNDKMCLPPRTVKIDLKIPEHKAGVKLKEVK